MIKILDTVKDSVTGTKAIVYGIAEYYNGERRMWCAEIGSKLKGNVWIEESRLTKVKKKKGKKSAKKRKKEKK